MRRQSSGTTRITRRQLIATVSGALANVGASSSLMNDRRKHARLQRMNYALTGVAHKAADRAPQVLILKQRSE
jgi:hypothetical protein